MLYFAISFVLLLLDQASKQYMSSILPLCQPGYCQSIEILPIFKLTVVHNEGAAFSFLSDAGGWQRWLLVSISIFASLFVAVWLYRVSRQEKLLALALAFILGGALGNLVDRALLGYVVDFIVVYYESYYFPAFNIADSAITIGAGFLILDMFINYRKGVDE
jgi:signal peptidase II|tara:strand:- start:766 stop:1251 length:486 start_codon:yes stop_codon:yes gene_type:complete